MAIERLKSELKIATDGFDPKIPVALGFLPLVKSHFQSPTNTYAWLSLWSLLEISGNLGSNRTKVPKGRIYQLGDCRIYTQNAAHFSLFSLFFVRIRDIAGGFWGPPPTFICAHWTPFLAGI